MDSLPKALKKDDIKRYQKKHHDQSGNLAKINQNTISNRKNWTDINQLIECVPFNLFREEPTQN